MRTATYAAPAAYLRAGALARRAAWCNPLSWQTAGDRNLPVQKVDAVAPYLARSRTASVYVGLTRSQHDNLACFPSVEEEGCRAV